jgi:hypothetical protein
LYNKACYEALLAHEKGSEAIKEQALADLSRSIELSEANRNDALKDSDFSSLENDAPFQRIVRGDRAIAAPEHAKGAA